MSAATDKADALHAAARRRYNAIDADARLSDTGKRQHKAEAYLELKRELDTLRTTAEAARTARTLELNRRLFGLPTNPTATDVIAQRDAEDRASRFETIEAAAAAMSRAHDRGDLSMVKAITARAIDAGWQPIVTAYVEQVAPETATLMAELQRGGPTAGEQFEEAGHYLAFAPPGMAGMADWQIEGELARLQSGANA